jgi:hypothetical protein
VGAEIENGFAAFIPDANILCRFACDGDGVAAKACLCAKDAASPPLAREAMQTETRIGLSLVVAESCPQLQEAVRVVMVPSQV